jgi:hypothetical protein
MWAIGLQFKTNLILNFALDNSGSFPFLIQFYQYMYFIKLDGIIYKLSNLIQ